MKADKDTYKTILKATPEVIFKDRGSKFFGYAFPIKNEVEAKSRIERLKKKHYNARHWCYAWQIGESYDQFRVNDDGEPSNSAGMPIFGQLQSFDVTNILVVVVRYFGGTKLGVGGLIQAYKSAAKMALEEAKIVERTIDEILLIQFDYPEMNLVMRILKDENLKIKKQTLELRCAMEILVRQKDSNRVYDLFEKTYKVEIKKLEN